MSLRSRVAKLAALTLAVPVLLVAGAGSASAATGTTAPDCVGPQAVSSRTFTIVRDGKTIPSADMVEVQAGDRVTATFTGAPGCNGTRVGFASYRSTQAPGEGVNKPQQLFDSSTLVLNGKQQSLVVNVPVPPAGAPTAGSCPNKHEGADAGSGANGPGSYGNTCDGSASQNGRGDGTASGKPCAGCVGNADDKNPPGQRPNGSDANAGYECDRNQGVGQSNPAHTGCTTGTGDYFQVDLFTGPVLQQVVPDYYFDRLIWGKNG